MNNRKKPPLSAEKIGSFNRTMRWLAPLPPLDWRWHATCQAAHGVPVPSDLADFIDVDAVVYLKVLAACRTDDERAAVQARRPAFTEALTIYTGNDPQTWEIQSRLAAGATDAEIASRCGMDAAIVADFERFFWSVREFFDLPGWLYRKLFPGWLWPTFRDDELDRFWLFAALDGGAATLDIFIEAFHAAWKTGTAPVLSVYLQPNSPVPLNMQAAVATFVLPANQNTAEAWITSHLRLMQVEAMPDPRQSEIAFLRLRQDFAAYARGVLDGKPPEKLRHLLRLGPRNRNGRGEGLVREAALEDLRLKLTLDQPPLAVRQGGAVRSMQHKVGYGLGAQERDESAILL